jgi:hypothetical protein
MICTSLGDIIKPESFPAALFIRRYIGCKFVCYNLKYDAGALLQGLPKSKLQELRINNKTLHKGYFYRIITNKLLSIRRGKNTIHIYDIAKFYEMSLDNAAKKYLGKQKIEIGTKTFYPDYVAKNFSKIAEYCIYDAVLCKELADRLIISFENLGIYPKKLYSQAYISWEYFKQNCKWINVKWLYWHRREVIDYAMQSYNGGKFEVTRKGCGYYYEYDIVSAYPNEIKNLIDISDCYIEQTRKYVTDAVYAFLKCYIKIPVAVNSPIALKRGVLNYYPCGEFTKVITKSEYDWLISQQVDITIIKGYWLIVDEISYPYKEAVEALVLLKEKYKLLKDESMYNTTKKILNSFYGKMIQLIKSGSKWRAGSSWNPIYGSIITANTRLRVTDLQQKYNSIVAVHTDSVISTKPLPFTASRELGDMSYECEGNGVILGSGIYQVGTKSKIRGFQTEKPLLELIPRQGNIMHTKHCRPLGWREIVFRNMSTQYINRFTDMQHDLNINFDTKRIWLNDYKSFKEVRTRNVESMPWSASLQEYR